MSISLSAASFRANGVANTRAPSALLEGAGDPCFCWGADGGGGGGGGGVDFDCSGCFGGGGGGAGAAAGAGVAAAAAAGAPVSSDAL